MGVSEPAKQEDRDGLCGICPAGCWIRATTRDGRLVGVQALPDSFLVGPDGMLLLRSPSAVELRRALRILVQK